MLAIFVTVITLVTRAQKRRLAPPGAEPIPVRVETDIRR
jgi:hypothetical protein